MLNTIIHRFDCYHKEERPEEIIALESAGIINVKMHVSFWVDKISFPNAETIRHDFAYYWEEEWNEGPSNSKILYDFDDDLLEFLQVHARLYYDYTQKNTGVYTRNISNDTNLFYRLVNYFYNKIMEHDIQLVMFDETPHYGVGWILYRVSQYCKLKIIIFQQHIYLDQCFAVRNHTDLGNIIETISILSDVPTYKSLESGFSTDLYYMYGRIPEDNIAKFITFYHNLLCDMINVIIKKYDVSYFSKRHINHRDIYLHSLYDAAPLYIRYKSAQIAQQYYLSTVKHDIDLKRPFILFCLHYQPELTTSPLGGKYNDQIRAIEELRSILPLDVAIYVKDHPASFGAQRGHDFYCRLRSIHNTILVDTNFHTHTLMAHSLFVATITGTAGFEAIKGGKNVITFGYAWYNNLPGVFKWKNKPTYTDIIAYKFKHDDLVTKFNHLSKHIATVCPYWGLEKAFIPQNLDRENNTQEFVRVVKIMLE